MNLKFNALTGMPANYALYKEKTDIPVSLPLDTTTGNAIADYILNARPKCDSSMCFTDTASLYQAQKYVDCDCKICSYHWGKSRRMNGPHAFRRGEMGRPLLEA